MVKKKYLTTFGAIWLACLFLLCFMPQALADHTASIRLNKTVYAQGDQVSVWITLNIDDTIEVDKHFFKKKWPTMLDVIDPSGNKIPPIKGDHGDAQPIPPDAATVSFSGTHEVKILDLWDNYEDPGIFGPYSVQFVLSMTEYDGGVAVEKVVSSNIEKFIIYTEATVSLECAPDPLNHANTPKWVTCYITDFPEGVGPEDADVASFRLYNAEGDYVVADWGDVQSADQLMIKFPGPEASAMMDPPKELLKVTGWLGEYVQCSGTDTIKVK